MITHNRSFYLVLTLLFSSILVVGQHTKAEDASDAQIKEVAKEIMTAASTCALITIDEKGSPRVRTMDTFLPENDFTVWFGTNPKSRKVAQIKNNPKVTLYYTAANNSGYVTIHGEAQLINDAKEKEKRWKPGWDAFYPNRDESYVLIKILPKWMEVVSFNHDLVGDEKTWEPPIVFFNVKKNE